MAELHAAGVISGVTLCFAADTAGEGTNRMRSRHGIEDVESGRWILIVIFLARAVQLDEPVKPQNQPGRPRVDSGKDCRILQVRCPSVQVEMSG